MTALGEHMSTGRLDLDEFDLRSAKAGSARTVGELKQLFADLPAPYPPLPEQAASTATLTQPSAGPVQQQGGTSTPALVDNRSRAQRFVAAAAGASSTVALVLFLITHMWEWFLLIPLISAAAGGIWGDSWKSPDFRDEGH